MTTDPCRFFRLKLAHFFLMHRVHCVPLSELQALGDSRFAILSKPVHLNIVRGTNYRDTILRR